MSQRAEAVFPENAVYISPLTEAELVYLEKNSGATECIFAVRSGLNGNIIWAFELFHEAWACSEDDGYEPHLLQ